MKFGSNQLWNGFSRHQHNQEEIVTETLFAPFVDIQNARTGRAFEIELHQHSPNCDPQVIKQFLRGKQYSVIKEDWQTWHTNLAHILEFYVYVSLLKALTFPS